MADRFKFGDLVCQVGGTHDGPTMFIATCRHPGRDGGGPGMIDILGLGTEFINHKDPAMWRRCTHFDKPRAAGAGHPVEIMLDGKPINPAFIEFKELKHFDGTTYEAFEISGDIGRGELTFRYEDTLP